MNSLDIAIAATSSAVAMGDKVIFVKIYLIRSIYINSE
jgi:hypothetical protein